MLGGLWRVGDERLLCLQDRRANAITAMAGNGCVDPINNFWVCQVIEYAALVAMHET